jgi:allantoicase
MEQTIQREQALFTGLFDLASERLGGQVIAASDEFFAEKENLIKNGAPVFDAERYTDRGKWMDGWETRRRRTPGHDWCIVRLGLPGMIRGVDIDTSYFLGNHPTHASIEACCLAGDPDEELLADDEIWTEIVSKTGIKPGSQNLFPVKIKSRFTHVRLRIFPDGGVARLRVYGAVAPVWSRTSDSDLVDLASMANGGLVISASDMFFGSRENLILPGHPSSMKDGWETRRRRGPGYDWTIVRLGHPGRVRRIEVDTSFFKGNYPDTCSIEGCFAPDRSVVDPITPAESAWKPLLAQTKLEADRIHVFVSELEDLGTCTHVRLNIYPDGGVARLRVFAIPAE